MKKKYRLTDYTDQNKPVVFFGMYNHRDFYRAYHHKSEAILVWCGSDSLIYLEQHANDIKNLNVRHIAMSEFISDDLIRHGIPHQVLPITPTFAIKNKKPRGENIYAYVNSQRDEKYGFHLMEEIREKSGKNIIIADSKTYNKAQLDKAYESCFLGLRLTKHDGLPNTVVELGLMGRRCVYNGKLPNAIPYTDVDSIVDIIEIEYLYRNQDNTGIIDSMFDYLDIGDGWLDV